jgi:hypothetical protein
MKSNLVFAGCAMLVSACATPVQVATVPAVGTGSAAQSAASVRPVTFLRSPGRPTAEAFSASNVLVTRAPYCADPSPVKAAFAASGAASGRYHGTFIASGHWQAFIDDSFVSWTFDESFRITSNGKTIRGTVRDHGASSAPPLIYCFRFGPAGSRYGLRYKIGSRAGSMTTSRIQDGQPFQQEFVPQ